MDNEKKCPFSGKAHSGTSNRDWWPNQLNLNVLHRNPPDGRSHGRGVRLRRGVQEPRPRCPEEGHRGGDDDVAGLVAGGLRPLRAALHPDGVAQRRHVPHQRRPRRCGLRRAALCAPQQLAGQREPRQGAPAALAGQEEVRPEDLVGRPDGLRRQLRPGVDGVQDLRLRRRARGRLGAGSTSTGAPRTTWLDDKRYSGDRAARESSGRRPDGSHLREPGGAQRQPRSRSPPPGTSARRSVAWR